MSVPVPGPGQLPSPELLQQYNTQFNLSGQLDLLLEIHRVCNLTGKAVLEIGGSNIPRPFVFEVLQARQWVSVDRVYPQNRLLWPRQYEQIGVMKLTPDVEFDLLPNQIILDGSVEILPASFAGRFDAVVSIDAFEHIHRFSSMLGHAYDALKPGGKLVAIYSAIWPSRVGHHLWGVTDKKGRTFHIESSPIPPWGHLLLRPPEMYRYLLDHTDPETADEIVFQVYHSENLNRLFVEDFEAYLQSSRFETHSVRHPSFISDVEPPPEVQRELERLHPGRKQFSRNGLLVCCEKRG